MKQTVVIVGGNGFVGKNFTSYFADKGYNVIVADHSIKKIDKVNSDIDFVAVDIHHTKELLNIAEKADYVIWLVHASVPSTQDESLVDDFSLNVSPIVKFLEKAGSFINLKKFIYLSSGGTVYGDTLNHEPIKETHQQNPISNYGLSKSIAEKYIEYITKGKPFETVVLRPSNVYGPYQNLVKPQGIIGYALKSIKNNTTLDLYDDGRVIRDFIYVEDLADAVGKFFTNDSKPGEVSFYNVGSNEGYSIKDILNKIEKITEKKLQLNHKSSRNFDCEYNVLDTSKLNKDKSWSKETSIEDGLAKVWDWINKEK
ncbi:NAD-dependent epimerase/dehydratase family protein [Chryseobacterium arthrosphaerae]|uniref:NAD-dependent epimerase/dehydratase family protein n=1 Tax=Chryseobacterium arthrosphaerae TaxID=651561 RepID=UPI00241F312A|nr:NAD-dependent epimerase/dehydratase family protein [Chryseobacterium arthrosphaerae]